MREVPLKPEKIWKEFKNKMRESLMKIAFKTLLTGFLCLSILSAGAYAEDKYDQLAREITEAGLSIQGKKIAIIPFSYADGRAGATKDGSVISERLTIKMINMHKFEIIERSVLDKVMTELKLQASGMIDATSAQQLGKVLGVEAIVTGTLVEMQAGEIEVNARLIKTETAQAIGASQVSVPKNWMGDASAAPQQPVYQQPAQQPTYQQPTYQQPAYQQPVQAAPPVRRARGENEYGYFDIFLGMGSPNMALEFTNPTPIPAHELDLPAEYAGPYRSVRFDKIATAGFGPLAMRVGGYGNNNTGGAFEFGLERRNIKRQSTTVYLNGTPKSLRFLTDDYLTATSFYMAGNLMIRFAKKSPVEPYIGFGLGLSLNAINMPSVEGYTNTTTSKVPPTNDFGLGLVFNMPFGIRIKVADKTQLVAEMRYQINTIMFDRGVMSDSDTLTISGLYFNVGMGFNF